MANIKCPLCNNNIDNTLFEKYIRRKFYKCNNCKALFADEDSIPNLDNEKKKI